MQLPLILFYQDIGVVDPGEIGRGVGAQKPEVGDRLGWGLSD